LPVTLLPEMLIPPLRLPVALRLVLISSRAWVVDGKVSAVRLYEDTAAQDAAFGK